MKDLILRTEDISMDNYGLFSVARRLFNRTMTTRIIPKKEWMVQLGGTSLVVSSITIIFCLLTSRRVEAKRRNEYSIVKRYPKKQLSYCPIIPHLLTGRPKYNLKMP
jgi:hypothetical protein